MFMRKGKGYESLPRNGYFYQYLRYAQILILEIFPYIPAGNIFACLDLEKTISFLDGH